MKHVINYTGKSVPKINGQRDTIHIGKSVIKLTVSTIFLNF